MTSVASRQEHDSGDYSDSFHQENEPDNSGNDGGQLESDYESAGSDSERSRDQDTQEIERRVDDDEDRSNPQYIPKRGTFYEHDDRTAASLEESNKPTSETAAEKREGTETPSERRRPPRKSDTNKWAHDKYNENEQAPKSRDELVAIYGYDIRNEDAPPHARRNRRYGRGPNKYTRTWEDEEAYKRQAAAAPTPRKPPTAEDFPELDARNNYNSKKRIPRPRSKSQPSSNESVENGVPLRRNASTKVKKAPQKPVANRMSRQNDRNNSNDKMPAIENLTISATVINSSQGTQVQRKANVNVAQQRPVPTEQAKKKPQPLVQSPIQNNVALNKPPPQQNQQPLSQPQKQQISNQQPQQQLTGPESRGGSKRYSSLRQRPIDTYCPPQNQQQPPPQQPQLIPQQQQQQQSQLQQQQSQQIISQQQQQSQLQAQQQAQQQIYLTEYPSAPNQAASQQPSGPAQIHPQQMMQQMHRNVAVSQPSHGPSPPHQHPQQMQHSQQVRIGILEQQQLVQHPHHSIHNMQQQHIGQLQQPQGYAPPAMMPAQYMQQPQASGAVFGAAPIYAQPPAPYPHQMYTPHHNYAQAGGVTYFTCAEQEQPRAQRRPTAAIPIVKPQASERQVNSSEKDNIDRIVENMFVRKPWPAAHGADSKEGKSEARSSQEPPSKESSQPNSLTSSSISTDSKPSEPKEEVKELKEVNEITEVKEVREVKEEDRDTNESEGLTEAVATQDSISTEA